MPLMARCHCIIVGKLRSLINNNPTKALLVMIWSKWCENLPPRIIWFNTLIYYLPIFDLLLTNIAQGMSRSRFCCSLFCILLNKNEIALTVLNLLCWSRSCFVLHRKHLELYIKSSYAYCSTCQSIPFCICIQMRCCNSRSDIQEGEYILSNIDPTKAM